MRKKSCIIGLCLIEGTHTCTGLSSRKDHIKGQLQKQSNKEKAASVKAFATNTGNWNCDVLTSFVAVLLRSAIFAAPCPTLPAKSVALLRDVLCISALCQLRLLAHRQTLELRIPLMEGGKLLYDKQQLKTFLFMTLAASSTMSRNEVSSMQPKLLKLKEIPSPSTSNFAFYNCQCYSDLPRNVI